MQLRTTNTSEEKEKASASHAWIVHDLPEYFSLILFPSWRVDVIHPPALGCANSPASRKYRRNQQHSDEIFKFIRFIN